MPGGQPLAFPSDEIYLYDGSLQGLYCCVFASVYSKRIPFAILQDGSAQPTLFTQFIIETDPAKAARVRDSINAKISPRALELVENVFCSCLKEKELAILRFLLKAYREGAKTPYMLGHPDVAPLIKAEKHLMGECHLLLGFIRFSDYDGVLAATITPKNFVLPYIAEHFTGRFHNEEFLIYDKTHKAALVYQQKQARIIPLEDIDFPLVSQEEELCRALWKRFYKTIAVKGRENAKCRMTHMPKRYWENMTEMQELL